MRCYDVVAAVQESKNRVHNILTAELPLLVSSKESSSTNVSGDVTSDKTGTETHHIKWSAKFDQIKKALLDEEKDLVRTYPLTFKQRMIIPVVLKLEAMFFFWKFAGTVIKPSEGDAVTMQRRSTTNG